ncbi:hypothetical protein GCM10010232_17480 [Streptomyces amakusaensis]|uniref:Uncharacterized protein n=1 Tax=Streptomyces amakusaensis TaxID=67271 RepID=A0ABW0ARE6_9ACTN
MDLQVDTDELDRLSRALRRSLSSLTDAGRALSRARADQLGTGELDAACDAFQERWAYGAERLRDRIGSIHDGVRLSHQGYTQVNAAVAASFRTVAPHE